MAEDKTFTQEEVNALVGKARQEGKDAGRKEFEGWISPDDMTAKIGSLSDQVKTLTDEKNNLQTQLTEKDGKIAQYEIDSVKTRVARELGLSYGAVDFIQGDTEEAIKQSAEKLKGFVGTVTPPFGNPEPPIEEDGVMKAFRELNPNIKL